MELITIYPAIRDVLLQKGKCDFTLHSCFREKGTYYCRDPFVGGGFRVRPGQYLTKSSTSLGIPSKTTILSNFYFSDSFNFG